jgi:cysteinyl-tRNA synthetase
MPLELYNTLTNRNEPFTATDSDLVRVYSCGPTVYDYAHIGNFRSFLTADVLRRTLEMLGYQVRQVMNMTDVGHMSDDDDPDGAGEDKMQVAARRLLEAKKSGTLPEGVDLDPADPYAIAGFYAEAFLADARALGLRVVADADAGRVEMPRPTAYIAQMIALVQRLIGAGHAYVAGDGVVYFDVTSFDRYGQLSGNTLDQLRAGGGGRVDEKNQSHKRHPADFMLWKPDPSHVMRWPSPWGEGYPGWHLECSAMALTLLGGDTNGVIDIHTGGQDNIFPHHECEIAQTCAATGEGYFARYWVHTRFLRVEGEKMSKSKGNVYTLADLLKRGASPAAVRLELIRTHYRSHANFTFQGLRDAQRQVDRWARLRDWMRDAAALGAAGPGHLRAALPGFQDALQRDLNISGALGQLSEAAGRYDLQGLPPAGAVPYTNELAALAIMDGVVGVLDLEREASVEASDLDVPAIAAKLAERDQARARRDWATADRIRDELLALDIAIKDSPAGTTWTRVLK